MDLTTATPVEIDTQLFDLYLQRQRTLQELERVNLTIRHIAGDKQVYSYIGRRQESRWTLSLEEAIAKAEAVAERVPQTYVEQQAIEALNDRDGCFNVLDVNREETEVFNAEFERRGGWTRAFLVTDGHVHSSMACSTCYPTTQFFWLVEFSGKNEAEIVEAAGERACTVCYPTAPTLRSFEKASTLFTPEERDRAAERDKRAQEKAARLQAKIDKGLTADGSEFVVRYDGRREFFKTERSAVSWAVDKLAQSKSSTGYKKLWTEEVAAACKTIAEAVAIKHNTTVTTVWTEWDKKATAKCRKEYGY